MRNLLITSALSLFIATSAFAATKNSEYKLGIVIAVDQFRADYLMRFRNEFKGGFKQLMEQGAYFPLADHGLLQNMTCPGHAAILTGSYPYRNHIPINTWFDRASGNKMYCVQDDAAKIVGSEGVREHTELGISPRNLNASTLGDELKNADYTSRTVSVALKDRAAVLMGGHLTDATVWFDDEHCEWVTSDFFSKMLPEFAQKQNTIVKRDDQSPLTWGPFKNVKHCSKDGIATPWGVEKTLALATQAIEGMRLGQGKDADLLSISISSHDMLGHRYGPNSAEMKWITLEEDRLLGEFLKSVAQKVPGGLSNVFVVLTGDHGMIPNNLPKVKIYSENTGTTRTQKVIEEALTSAFGKPKNGNWVQADFEAQYYFNEDNLSEKKLSKAQVYAVAREKLLKEYYVDDVLSREAILTDRKLPAGELGQIVDRTVTDRSGDLIVMFKPYYYVDTSPFTHMTHYSYDRYVPLILMGKTFKQGTYRQIVRVVDLAPTLASVLHVIPPNQSEGRVITEILR